jgi:hypothetical protein
VFGVLFRKGPLPNQLAPLLFVGMMGKSCCITSWSFLGVGSRESEGIGGSTIGFFWSFLLVFLPDEEVGISTRFWYCSSKERVCAREFGVLGERGLDGEIFFRLSGFLSGLNYQVRVCKLVDKGIPIFPLFL